MARTANIDTLDKKIEKAEQALVKSKERYDEAAAALKDLLDKRDAIRRDQLVKAIMNSSKSYEEILQFIEEDSMDSED